MDVISKGKKSAVTAAASFAALFGLAALLGWQYGIEFLKRLPPGKVAMNPLTAVSFVLAGASLILLSLEGRGGAARRIASVSATTVVLFALSRLVGLFGFDPQLDRALYSNDLADNRMAPNTALAFLLVGCSLIFSSFQNARLRGFADYSNTLSLVISVLALTGYFYGTQELYGIATFIPMALNTGVAFFVMSLGIFALRSPEGVAGVFTARDLGGSVARRLLPVVVITPLALGGIRIYGQRAGWYDFEFGASLLVALTMTVLGFLTWKFAKSMGEMDRALKEQGRQLESILSSIGDGVIVTDGVREISMYNRAADEVLDVGLYAKNREGWANKYKVSALNDKRALTLSQVLSNTGEMELLCESEEGTSKYIGIRNRPVKGTDGADLGKVAIVRDVSETKKELGQARSQVEQLQKLDAIGRLAGGIAHDFNNILGIVQMYCDLISGRMEDRAKVQDGLKQIEKATKRGAALTRQLLIFSRKKVVELQPVDLNALIKELFKMLDRLIGENISVELKLSEKTPAISADPGQIEQVVMNLVINARDAMPDGGKIVVETCYENLTEEFASTHLSSKLGPHVLLSVADTGTGMDEKTKQKIFEPFFTTKPVGQGTGLGLATVYGIVKSLEGTIWVYSEIDKGTVFKIYLPVAETTAQPQKEEGEVQGLEGKETILVVEDEPNLRSLYAEMLRKYGYKVITAENGRVALEVMERDENGIDVVLTDMIMPEMGGSALVQSIFSRQLRTKVLCMSGYPGEDADTRLLKSAQVGYLSKPFNTVALLTKIRKLLDA